MAVARGRSRHFRAPGVVLDHPRQLGRGVGDIGVGPSPRAIDQIVAVQRKQGVAVDTIVVSGGAAQSPLVRQILADATGLAVAASSSPEPVLLGSAMLGAVAAGDHDDVSQAMEAMSTLGEMHRPQPELAEWHDRRFKAFEALQGVGREIRNG